MRGDDRIHPRLRAALRRPGPARGLAALLTLAVTLVQVAQVSAMVTPAASDVGCGCAATCSCRAEAHGACTCARGAAGWRSACGCSGGEDGDSEAAPTPLAATLAVSPTVERHDDGSTLNVDPQAPPTERGSRKPELPP